MRPRMVLLSHPRQRHKTHISLRRGNRCVWRSGSRQSGCPSHDLIYSPSHDRIYLVNDNDDIARPSGWGHHLYDGVPKRLG